VIHTFDQDFYGETVKVIVTGFIRPEYNYSSKGAPIQCYSSSGPSFVRKLIVTSLNFLFLLLAGGSPDSLEALIQDIEIDKTAALQSLKRPDYQAFSEDEFLLKN
jgi:riboflavin kinase